MKNYNIPEECHKVLGNLLSLYMMVIKLQVNKIQKIINKHKLI